MLKQLSLFVLVVVCGCASVQEVNLDQNALQGLGKEVVAVKRTMPDFSVVRSNTAASVLGPIAVFAAEPGQIKAGNSLSKENNIADPAYEIAEALAHMMHAEYGLMYKGVGESLVADDDVQDIANAYRGSPLAIDVKTTRWAVIPFSSGRGYRVVYRARSRLIDTKNARIIAEGSCASIPQEPDDPPGYDELVGNGATRLKEELKKASQDCTRELATTYLRTK